MSADVDLLPCCNCHHILAEHHGRFCLPSKKGGAWCNCREFRLRPGRRPK